MLDWLFKKPPPIPWEAALKQAPPVDDFPTVRASLLKWRQEFMEQDAELGRRISKIHVVLDAFEEG